MSVDNSGYFDPPSFPVAPSGGLKPISTGGGTTIPSSAASPSSGGLSVPINSPPPTPIPSNEGVQITSPSGQTGTVYTGSTPGYMTVDTNDGYQEVAISPVASGKASTITVGTSGGGTFTTQTIVSPTSFPGVGFTSTGHVLPTYTIGGTEYGSDSPYYQAIFEQESSKAKDFDWGKVTSTSVPTPSNWDYTPGGSGVSAWELARAGIAPNTGIYGQQNYQTLQILSTIPGGKKNSLFQEYLGSGRSSIEATQAIMKDIRDVPVKEVADSKGNPILVYDMVKILGDPKLINRYTNLVDINFSKIAKYIKDGSMTREDLASAVRDKIPYEYLAKYGVNEEDYKIASESVTSKILTSNGSGLFSNDQTSRVAKSLLVGPDEEPTTIRTSNKRDIFGGAVSVGIKRV